ncbi:MAG: 3D domain-containing protein [Longicatena sp.]
MKSKRMKFALFTCVFALYGCASVASVANHNQITSEVLTNNASYKKGFVNVSSQDSVDAIAFQSNALYPEDSGIFKKIRNAKGELLVKEDVLKVSSELNKKAKEEVARQIALAKEEAKKAQLEEAAKNSSETFHPLITTYGVDCYGCNVVNGRGGTAMGVALDLALGVQMSDGSWQPGIKYGNYYIIAADPSIPMCSIMKISNHGLSGSGITPDQPYYAIVLDRGGAIQGSHLDLYTGSESAPAVVPVTRANPTATLIRRGGQISGGCAL